VHDVGDVFGGQELFGMRFQAIIRGQGWTSG
jgi:hypothetical protein